MKATLKKLEPELTADDKDKLKRLADVIPVVKYALTYIKHLENRVETLSSFARGVNEALNSGDGTYKP